MNTLRELFDFYLSVKPGLKEATRMRRTFNCYLRAFSEIAPHELTSKQCETLLASLALNVSEKTSNNTLELISTIYNTGIKHHVIPNCNPVCGFKKYVLVKRERCLAPNELPQFFKSLADNKNETIRDFILLCLFTGEQKTKVLSLTWQELDLTRGLWLIPQPKSRFRILYLLPEVLEILLRRKADSISEFVFANKCIHENCKSNCTSQVGYLRDPDKSWATIRKRAKLVDFRLNDLRNSRQNLEPIREAYLKHYYPEPAAITREKAALRHAIASKKGAQHQREVEYLKSRLAALSEPKSASAPRIFYREDSRYKGKPTFEYLFEYYMDHHGDRCKTANQIRANYRRYLSGFGKQLAEDIKPSTVAQLHQYLGKHAGPTAANRAVEILKMVFNRAIRWELIDFRNPAIAVEHFQLESRDRFLSALEVEQLLTTLDRHSNPAFRDFIKLCLFTSARAGNVMSMRWEQLDYESQVWRIPSTKNGKPHVIPLIPEAFEVIESRRSAANDSDWVFPGEGRTGHMDNPNRSFHRIAQQAGISNIRIHDLRRTMGSWQAKTGSSLPIISKTLGHSNPSATAIYARLDNEPVRESMQKAVLAMTGASPKEPSQLPLSEVQLSALAQALAERINVKA